MRCRQRLRGSRVWPGSRRLHSATRCGSRRCSASSTPPARCCTVASYPNDLKCAARDRHMASQSSRSRGTVGLHQACGFERNDVAFRSSFCAGVNDQSLVRQDCRHRANILKSVCHGHRFCLSKVPALHQVHARENEDVVAAVLPEAQGLGFDLTVRRVELCLFPSSPGHLAHLLARKLLTV